MYTRDVEEERYRVLLDGIWDNTDAQREVFCKGVSEHYGISFSILRKFVDRCPVVFKKNLSRKKAETLARALESFGAVVSIEEKRSLLPVFLEYQEAAPYRLALESCVVRRTPSGSWSVIGRARNITREDLRDAWVLIQILGDFEELLTFEEIPFAINPLPAGMASPFKGVFEGELSVKRVFILFKEASGAPLSAMDLRKKKEWTRVEIVRERLPSGDRMAEPFKRTSVSSVEPDGGVPPFQRSEDSFLPDSEEGSPAKGLERDGGNKELWRDRNETAPMINPSPVQEVIVEDEVHLPKTDQDQENPLDEIPFDDGTQPTEEPMVGTEPEPFPWMEAFREAVARHYREPQDAFSIWFEESGEEHGFTGPLDALLAILVYSQLDQMSRPEKTLENTQKVFRLILKPKLRIEDIPPLWGTEFHSGEKWRELFYRATFRFQQVGQSILEKKKWKAMDLVRQIQVIPYMIERNSRRAVRWIDQWMQDVIEVDGSEASVLVSESLYRVSSRLGVVDPHFDFYRGKDSMGDLKIQSFAKRAFPGDPMKIEEPLTHIGMAEESGGHCFAYQPRCRTCLLEAFCPKLYLDFDPSDRGIRRL